MSRAVAYLLDTNVVGIVAAASKLRDNYLSDFLVMLGEAINYKTVPKKFKISRIPNFDAAP